MKKIFIILVILCFASCVTEKQRLKICDSCAVKTVSKDSVWEHVVRDTITLPPIVGPVQYLENPCKELCDSLGHLKPFIKTETKNGITGTIKSVGNIIAFDCAADSLLAYIDCINEEWFYKKENSFIKNIPCSLKHETKFDGFTFWWFWITLALILIVCGVKGAKMYFKN